MPETLMEKTRRLLRESPLSLPDVHAELRMAGINDISYYWLRKFSSGAFRDPSVNKVQRLYEFLTGTVLTV
jgi:hypothetical protein